jgi:hypothetical protein
MGTIFLSIEHENLYEAWNEAFLDDHISGFVKESDFQKCISESYMI